MSDLLAMHAWMYGNAPLLFYFVANDFIAIDAIDDALWLGLIETLILTMIIHM